MPSCNVYSSVVDLGLALVITPYREPRKKAFLIGIKALDLDGAHEDVKRFRGLLVDKFDFQDRDIIMMLDDGVGIQPTKINIMATLRTFLVGQRPGDLFVFVFAGHAKQAICLDGTERDGMDESIITCDDSKDGYITILDDVLNDYLVKPLSPGCSLVAFLDACHSETLLDLDHHVCNRPARGRRMVRRLREFAGFPAPTFTPGQITTATRFCNGLCSRVDMPGLIPNVICFSACKDSETVFEAVGHSMLNTVIRVLEADPSPSLKTLRRTLNESAREIYHKARRSNQRANKVNDSDESCVDNLCEVKRWAPQISSMMPLWMDCHLKL
ncbi:Metacaspase type II [Mycena venus]|uniref:Metacaspase type II n=1 Tax=Mycena venus TaxID=2733690 RepID=A0A8H7CG66_9AGAR|nr:Metacaspase type II [Mycena venus]